MGHKKFRFSIPRPGFRWPNPQVWHGWLPSRGNMLFTLLVVGLVLWVQGADAFPSRQQVASAPPTLIPYQGRLADASGNPLAGTYPMIFSLYSAAEGGTPIWTENWAGSNSVQVNDGLFNVMLGSFTEIPSEVITGQSSLWLGITVGTDDEMTPRVQVGSLPWAHQAMTVPDGSITSEKLLLDHGTRCLSEFKTISLSGNYARVDVPDLSLEFSLDQPANVLIWSDGMLRFNTGTDNQFHMSIDNARARSDLVWGSGDTAWANVQGQRMVYLYSGAHRLHAQVSSAVAGTATVRGGDIYSTCISYLVLGER
jgi:hypothetical protein